MTKGGGGLGKVLSWPLPQGVGPEGAAFRTKGRVGPARAEGDCQCDGTFVPNTSLPFASLRTKHPQDVHILVPCVPSGDTHCSALVTRPPRGCGPSWKILKSHMVSQSQQFEKELVTETLGKESGEKTRCLHLREIFAQQKKQVG